MTRLDQLHLGTSARLVRVGGTGPFRRRLLELGFTPGTCLRLIRRMDIGGVLEVEVRGARLSLRHSEARELGVEAL